MRRMPPTPFLSDLVRSLLERRGMKDPHEFTAFLLPDYDLHTHDAFLMPGMTEAVERVLRAIESRERIAIYADFDCDGIPGAALLNDLFAKIGYENIDTYIPHRDKEGYGFHKEAIASLAAAGTQLIITVDVGTTAVESAAYAAELGVDVIVTDHHEIHGELPQAVAVLNPKREPYPFPNLCGSGVAYKFAQALLSRGRERELPAFLSIPVGWEKWLLDLVAIATVADMVPLVGENRVLAYYGLMVLRRSSRPGIRALCNRLRLKREELTEDDIGFSIAPRINAASRMDEPQLALRLLITKDPAEAESLAATLEDLNASRKGVVSSIVRQAKKHVRDRFRDDETVIVFGSTEWKPALLGLAANSIVEERGGLVCMWGRDGNGKLKGSCRSDGSLSVVELFSSAGVFDEYGGHARSGGFSVSHERVHTLQEKLADAAKGLVRAESAAVREYDALISLPEVSASLMRDLSQLAPFGIDNPKPVFRIGDVMVTGMRRFGKEKSHIELSLECRRTGARSRAFDFFRGPEGFTCAPAQGSSVAVLATVERDTFRGGLALRLLDVLAQ